MDWTFWNRLAREAADGGNAGGSAAAAGADDGSGGAVSAADAANGGGAGTAAAADPAAGAVPAAGAGGAAQPGAAGADAGVWYDKLPEQAKNVLIGSGYHTAPDPVAALEKVLGSYDHAQKRLGVKPEELIRRPKDGQPLDEWVRANGKVFGLPEKPEDYKLAAPEKMPEGIAWDQELAGRIAQKAHAAGVPPVYAQKLAEIHLEEMGAGLHNAEQLLATHRETTLQELQREWGQQTQARRDVAAMGFRAMAEKAGLDEAQAAQVASALSGQLMKGGMAQPVADAAVVKMFHAIGAAMGEQGFKAPTAGGGVSLGGRATPAEARARLDSIRAPGGEYAQARARGDKAAEKRLLAEIEGLAKAIAPAPAP